MFGFDPKIIILVALIAVAVGALIYGILYNNIQNQRKSDTRIAQMSKNTNNFAQKRAANDRLAEMSKRKQSVQDSLKELEEKQKKSKSEKFSLKDRLAQAGLSVTVQKYYTFSLIFGFVAALVAFVLGKNPLIALGVFVVAGGGIPAWVISYLRKKRFNKFLLELPNALEVMVRSIKSGLPLNDAVRLIANESAEPVRGEFKKLVEEQQVGISIPDACGRMVRRVPLPETNFFAVVINIQSQAGGNLSEALGNLAKVLRERKMMKAKVKAMSMEAKASAVIIGALPFIVTLLVYMSSPDYMIILFTDPRGHLIMAASAVWMAMGVLMMRKMIDFEI